MSVLQKEQFTDLLAPLNFFLHLSRKAYSKYLSNRIFLHASCIYEANSRICTIIESHPALIPESLLDDMLELVNHYHIWMHQFAEHQEQVQPQLKDEFIYYHIDGQSAFPKEAEQRIFDFYNHVKQNFIYDK